MAISPEDIEIAQTAVSGTYNTAGWIGAIIAGLIPVVLGLRRWLSSDNTSREVNKAERTLLGILMDQLEAANDRADRFAKERNDAIREIGDIKAQMAALQATADHMQERICRLVPEDQDVDQP